MPCGEADSWGCPREGSQELLTKGPGRSHKHTGPCTHTYTRRAEKEDSEFVEAGIDLLPKGLISSGSVMVSKAAGLAHSKE